MTAIQLNIFDAPPPTVGRRVDLDGQHSATADLKAAFLRGEELTPMDALRYGMQANSFHRAMFYMRRDEGFVFIKTAHKQNGKIYYSYRLDMVNSRIVKGAA